MKKILLIILCCSSTVFGQVKTKVAILPFDGISQGDLVAKMLSQELAKGSILIPLTRSAKDIEKIKSEFRFQNSGLTSEQEKAQLGIAWNTKYIVSGEISKLGSMQILSISIFDVETFVTKTGETVVIDDIEDILVYIPQMAKSIADVFYSAPSDLNEILIRRKGQRGIEEIKTLVSRDVDAGNSDGKTSLMIASGYGYIDIVEYLLSQDVDVNARNINGVTALMFAAQDGRVEVVRYLLENGADANLRSLKGITARMLAESNRYRDIAVMIRNKER